MQGYEDIKDDIKRWFSKITHIQFIHANVVSNGWQSKAYGVLSIHLWCSYGSVQSLSFAFLTKKKVLKKSCTGCIFFQLNFGLKTRTLIFIFWNVWALSASDLKILCLFSIRKPFTSFFPNYWFCEMWYVHIICLFDKCNSIFSDSRKSLFWQERTWGVT